MAALPPAGSGTSRPYTAALVADLPIDLDASLAARLAHALDIEGKIPRAIEALGPVADRDVLLVDGTPGLRADQLAALGARVAFVPGHGKTRFRAADASADVVVALWSALRGAAEDEVREAARLLRPGGRLLVVHDYGRDDVSLIRGDRPDYGAWTRRDGPFLGRGFKIRVVHCWWTFPDLDATRAFLDDAFGEAAQAVRDSLARPRLSYNVAIYHRTFGEAAS